MRREQLHNSQRPLRVLPQCYPLLVSGLLIGTLSGLPPFVGAQAQGVAPAPTTASPPPAPLSTSTATPITPTIPQSTSADPLAPAAPAQPSIAAPTQNQSSQGSSGPLSLNNATPAPPVCQLPTGALPLLNRTVFVLDTSGSMQGKGDGKADIFQRVKDSIQEYVQTVQPHSIELITFDSGVRLIKSYPWPSDAERFKSDLAAIEANGTNTYLYRSLQSVLTPLSSPDRYVTNVFVLTDGIDNDPDRRNTAQAALDAFAQRGSLDTLSYIALGTEIPEAARRAILQSSYASGITVPVGQVPRLFDIGIATQLLSANDPSNVPAPFPDGTRLTLQSTDPNLTLTQAEVANKAVRVSAPMGMQLGTPALLCASPDPRNNVVGARLRRALVTMNFEGQSGSLTLLNPHTKRVLNAGGDLRLIYRADASIDLGKNALSINTPSQAGGVEATVQRLPGAREFVVHYQSTGSLVNAEVRPSLILSSGRSILLDSLTLRGDGTVMSNPTSLEGQAKNPSFWLSVITSLILLAVAALIYFPIIFWDRRQELLANVKNGWQGGVRMVKQRQQARAQRKAPTAQEPPPHPDSAAAAARRLGRVTTRPPSLQGLEYSADRRLLLLDQADGRTPVPMPTSGPFDVGLLSRVPHLRDLRVDQRPEGLRLLHIPEDLHVHDNLRRLREGDIVAAGTILGIQIINPHRASYAALGKLVGLGLPLMLDTRGGGLRLSGPYADHMVVLHPGLNDLGDLVGAPALLGLKLSTSGPRILLAGLPAGMVLTDTASTQTLHPGAYLPEQTHIRLPDMAASTPAQNTLKRSANRPAEGSDGS